MRYLLNILLIFPLFGQGITLTQEEMLNIANNIKELQYSDSLKAVQLGICEELVEALEVQSETDSILILKKDEQIDLLKERDKANEQLVELVKPKWYDHRYLWFGIGLVIGFIE